MAAKKDLSYYLGLPYSSELSADEDGGYFARDPDLDGCAAQGDNIEEALIHLQIARELWLEGQLETGAQIPEPPNPEPSGRLMLRVPLHLHAELERHAAVAGISLNRLLNETLFDHANGLPFGYGLERLASDESRLIEALASGESRPTNEHLSREYSYLLTPDKAGGYTAEHSDLPGCTATGDSVAQAIAELDAARNLWIAGRVEDGLPVPTPIPPKHSGTINLRMPIALHYQLARDATRNGVSLNLWLNVALAEFTGAAAVHRGTRSQHLPGTDCQRHVIQPAVPLLRRTPNGPGRESTAKK